MHIEQLWPLNSKLWTVCGVIHTQFTILSSKVKVALCACVQIKKCCCRWSLASVPGSLPVFRGESLGPRLDEAIVILNLTCKVPPDSPSVMYVYTIAWPVYIVVCIGCVHYSTNCYDDLSGHCMNNTYFLDQWLVVTWLPHRITIITTVMQVEVVCLVCRPACQAVILKKLLYPRYLSSRKCC